MNEKMYQKLIRMEEVMKMEFNEPVNRIDLDAFERKYQGLPSNTKELLLVSNGVEIGVPGTVFYSLEKIEELYKLDKNIGKKNRIAIGRMSFGDDIYIKKDGVIIQIDHETGEEFLTWSSLGEFLDEELKNGLRG